MNENQLTQLFTNLAARGIELDQGLTSEEVELVQQKFGLIFPLDLRQLLQRALPASPGFCNWRHALQSQKVADSIFARLNSPLEGIQFDIKNNGFWVAGWGRKPATTTEQFAVANQQLSTYPQLIPIYSHRYIPSQPNIEGNPVFSVYQTDIIYYGYDLPSYLANEFGFALSRNFEILTEPRHEIEFWGSYF